MRQKSNLGRKLKVYRSINMINNLEHSCFMTGHVVGKEKLSTSLSLCGEVQGLLELDDEHWFIEQPHPDEKELGCDMLLSNSYKF